MGKTLVFALFLGLVFPLSATADSLAKFQGGIGVIPVSSGVGTAATATDVNRNIVRGVQPAGQIWVIADLQADVSGDGRIRVEGRGLLLGGGNNIGTNANQSVRATRCAPTTGTSCTTRTWSRSRLAATSGSTTCSRRPRRTRARVLCC